MHQIELTKDCVFGEKGDLGGWVEKLENIRDNAWVSEQAKVSGDAVISGNVKVIEDTFSEGL